MTLAGRTNALPRTETVARALAWPSAWAVSRLLPSARPVTSKLAPCRPAGINTDDGTESTLASELPNCTLTPRSEEHTSELQSPCNLVCPLLLETKKDL